MTPGFVVRLSLFKSVELRSDPGTLGLTPKRFVTP